MITLHQARECVDKEKFIYEKVKAQGGEAIVIVPNQYTLVAEEQALKYLGQECLFNVEIMSMNRLGLRLLTEQGLESVPMLSKYGRFMLLTKIISEHKDELKLFSKSVGKLTFTNMLNDFIADFKQQNCSVDELERMLTDDKTNTLLRDKLAELSGIIREYEAAIANTYTDSEDYIAMYVDAIKDSRLIAGKHIWIYSYDSVTPKFTSAVMELAKRAASVDMMVNESDFKLHELLVEQLSQAASAAGVELKIARLEQDEEASKYEAKHSETIKRIERGLFNNNPSSDEIAVNADFIPEDLKLVQCANQYYEAESAAAYIHHLVRDEGYRLREIAVIANDEHVMQPLIKRVFAEYGLEVFLDSSRRITDSASVACIANMLGALRYNYNTDRILAMLKTGLAGLSKDEIEELENYSRDYGIKFNMWTYDFKYGDEEKLAKLNELRAKAIEPLRELSTIIEKASSVANFVETYSTYLDTTWHLQEATEEIALRQEEAGLNEEAQRTRISLEEALKLLGQIKEIMGDYPMDLPEFLDIYLAGLMDIEVGVIPPSLDGLSMGTMIRTRPREARAVVVLGANEGIMPLQPQAEGLFSIDEKAYFRQRDFAIGALDDMKMLEENIAMYRILSHPVEKLYMSYAMADTEGKEMAASPLIDSLQSLFPKARIDKDIISEGWNMELVNDSYETLRHLVNHIKDRNTAAQGDSLTQALLHWYKENKPGELDTMIGLLEDENEMPRLDAKLAKTIYARKNGDYVMTASKFETYNSCPFRFFVGTGLRPKEERAFRSDPRSIGDMYHDCLMNIAGKVKDEFDKGIPFNDDDLELLVNQQLAELADAYQGGLFLSTENEKYRLDRIKEICLAATKAMLLQLKKGSVKTIFLEEEIGRGENAEFEPVELEINGEKVRIEGRIDRADVLEENKIRIIDYKTGDDKLDFNKMKQGYHMQLMIYMMSAMNKYEPAGIFYFNIKDQEQSLNGSNASEDAKVRGAEPEDKFKLKGAYLDEPGVLEMMPEEAVHNASRAKLSGEAFDEVLAAVNAKLGELSQSMVEGDISISPLRVKGHRMTCEYCDYKAICRYDSDNHGNRSREI